MSFEAYNREGIQQARDNERQDFEIAADRIYADPHQWSTRGCATCKEITALLGKPFGCDRYRLARTAPTAGGGR